MRDREREGEERKEGEEGEKRRRKGGKRKRGEESEDDRRRQVQEEGDAGWMVGCKRREWKSLSQAQGRLEYTGTRT